MEVPKFREAVAVSHGGIVYVFPIDRPDTVFIWDVDETGDDWANWFVVTEERAFKMVLYVGNKPYAAIGSISEDWFDIIFKPRFQIPPTMFFILIYVAANFTSFLEPRVLSIKDFDKEKVRTLARELGALWMNMYSFDDDDSDYEDFGAVVEYEEEEEEDEGEEECYWCIDKERGLCYSCED